jgi:hypothetical protein
MVRFNWRIALILVSSSATCRNAMRFTSALDRRLSE